MNKAKNNTVPVWEKPESRRVEIKESSPKVIRLQRRLLHLPTALAVKLYLV